MHQKSALCWFGCQKVEDFPSNDVAVNESIHARIRWRLMDVPETACQIAEAQRQAGTDHPSAWIISPLRAMRVKELALILYRLTIDTVAGQLWNSCFVFLLLVELPISSSPSSCERPTRCGWCFTERPYTMACLKSSLIVRWIASHCFVSIINS